MVIRIVEGSSRRGRDGTVRWGYLAVVTVLVLLGVLSGGGLGGEMSLGELAKAGSTVFNLVAYGQVILICLLAPLFMARAISSEQTGSTYNILLTTPMSNLQIVLGSLLGRLLLIWALLLSGLPLFSIMMIFGGVPISSIFVAFAIAALTAMFVGLVAVTLSVLRLGGRRSVFTFVIATIAYLLLTYLLDIIVLRQLSGAFGLTTVLTPLHPILVLESFLNTANYAPHDPASVAQNGWLAVLYFAKPLTTFTLFSLGGSVLLLLISAIGLRKAGQPSENKIIRSILKQLRLDKLTGGRKRQARSVWSNPIAWREAATRGKVSLGIISRFGFVALGVGLAIILVGAYHFNSLPQLGGGPAAGNQSWEVFHKFLTALLILEIALISLVAIYISAGSVSREREDGTLDILLTTPVTPKYYVWGKLRGLVSFLSLLILVPVATLLIAAIYSGFGWVLGWEKATYLYSGFGGYGSSARITQESLLVNIETPFLMLLFLVPWISLCVAVGMNASLKAKTVLGAILPSLVSLGGLALVLGFCGMSAASNIPIIGPVLNAFSPATNTVMLVRPFDFVADYIDHPPTGRLMMGIGSAITAGVYLFVVYTLISSMVRGFDHTVRKLSGTG